MPPRPISEYQVGWVCALPKELTAARAMLDEEHEELGSQTTQDDNSYVLGRIHGHNVVIACLPAGIYGTVSAATMANDMLRTFTGIRFGLMVGIGGGIPNLNKGVDIRLGDVVISQPNGTHGGVVQYDLGKNLAKDVFESQGLLRPPPKLLLTALANLQSRHQMYGNQISDTLSSMLQRLPRLAKMGYVHPGPETDVLYCSNVEDHKEGNCIQCRNGVIDRKPREDQNPEVHYGVIVSGNQLMKNVVERDRLGQEFGAKCIEMEAAGLMNDFPCIVIRGICDYADSHKNDIWQEYAAVTAAGFAKELLANVKPSEVITVTHATEMMKYHLGLNLFDAPGIGENLFIGRGPELQKMEKALRPKANSPDRRVLILGGVGGVGKTQLAITYAQNHRNSYTSIFWLNASSETILKISFRRIASRILPLETVSKLDEDLLCTHVSNWLSAQENIGWLLIMDNYDDPDQFDITKYYPAVSQGSIIITTRQPDRIIGELLKVGSMAKLEDGLEILASRSGRRNIQSAGAFLKYSSLSCLEYLELYSAKWDRVSTTELPEYGRRTLYNTWDLSFAQIQRLYPDVASLLDFLAYFDHHDIWFGLVASGRQQVTYSRHHELSKKRPVWFTTLTNDEASFTEAMVILTKYCLVESHHQNQSYSIHACIRNWVLSRLSRQIDTTQYWLAYDCVLSHITTRIRYEDEIWVELSKVKYRRIVPHALHLSQKQFQIVIDEQKLAQVMPTEIFPHSRLVEEFKKIEFLGDFLERQEQYDAAEKVFLRVITGCKKAVGLSDIWTVKVNHKLGNLYQNQGKLDLAEQMYNHALAGMEKALGTEDTWTLATVHGLGCLYQNQGKLDLAEQMYNRALAGHEKALGTEDTSTLTTVDNLGSLYLDQGKLDLAEQMYNRALAGHEKALGTEHTSTLTIVGNLGTIYLDQGKLDLAEQMYNRALAGKEKTLGTEHTSTLTIVGNLGTIYLDQGKLDLAEQMYNRALAGKEKTLGTEHTSTLTTVRNLGRLYQDQGKLDLAEQMYNRALAGQEKTLGTEHTSTLIIKVATGNLLCLQGQLSKAENMYQYAMSGFERVRGPDHIYILGTTNNIGNLYCIQHKWDEAKEMYERAVAGMSRALGRDHYYICGVANNRGLFCAERGELDAAEQLYEEARAGFERTLGPDHPHTKMVCYNIAQLNLAKVQAGASASSGIEATIAAESPRRRWFYR